MVSEGNGCASVVVALSHHL